MKYVLLFMGVTINSINAQVLHHQMLSSQGATVRLQNDMVITQTVGQANSIGSFNDYYYKGVQGFQQVAIIVRSKLVDQFELLNIKVYPNPFYTSISVTIPKSKSGDVVTVSVIDLMGRIVYKSEKYIQNEEFVMDLSNLPVANYILNIYYNKNKYISKLIKNEQ